MKKQVKFWRVRIGDLKADESTIFLNPFTALACPAG